MKTSRKYKKKEVQKSFLQFRVTIISYTSRIDVVNLEAYTDSCKIIDSDIGES
jgi:hypothetical protein